MLMKNETYCKGCGNSQQPVHFPPCSTCKAGTQNIPSHDHSLTDVCASSYLTKSSKPVGLASLKARRDAKVI